MKEARQPAKSASTEIARQAAMIGYVNGFGLFTAASAVAIVLVAFSGGRGKGA
ncbi:MAG: hypothetical protein ING24_13190 [Roseomonas sp.]|nr:hypothetical protein [Roseomonas sp.]MCA3343382.1 hypothetical protein [Roseomonas sp.]